MTISELVLVVLGVTLGYLVLLSIYTYFSWRAEIRKIDEEYSEKPNE